MTGVAVGAVEGVCAEAMPAAQSNTAGTTSKMDFDGRTGITISDQRCSVSYYSTCESRRPFGLYRDVTSKRLNRKRLHKRRDGNQTLRREIQMKINRWLAGAALVLPLVLAAQQASAQVDPDKLPKVSCSHLVFSHDFLAKYPKAPAACLEARVYKGHKYAKFSGKVFLTNPPDSITVQIFNVAGDPIDTVSFKPSPTAKLFVNGQPETFSELKKGDPVTFWVSEKRFSIYSTPGAAKSASAGLPPQ